MTSKEIAPHLLKTLLAFQRDGVVVTLELLTRALEVRRVDVRRAVTALHREGYLDATRMRLTFRGLALGATFAATPLRPLRRAPIRVVNAA